MEVSEQLHAPVALPPGEISLVGIAIGYGLENQGPKFDSRQDKDFLSSTSSRPALRSTQPNIQRVPGPISSEVKRLGREDDHSSPASAEVKKTWIDTATPLYAFMA
jgi:hypothetical protein